MVVIAQNNQSLLDIAIQITGTALNWLKIAVANDLVPTAKIIPGTAIIIPDNLDYNTDVARYYNASGIVPSTALSGVIIPQLSCLEKLYNCFK